MKPLYKPIRPLTIDYFNMYMKQLSGQLAAQEYRLTTLMDNNQRALYQLLDKSNIINICQQEGKNGSIPIVPKIDAVFNQTKKMFYYCNVCCKTVTTANDRCCWDITGFKLSTIESVWLDDSVHSIRVCYKSACCARALAHKYAECVHCYGGKPSPPVKEIVSYVQCDSCAHIHKTIDSHNIYLTNVKKLGADLPFKKTTANSDLHYLKLCPECCVDFTYNVSQWFSFGGTNDQTKQKKIKKYTNSTWICSNDKIVKKN